MRSRTAEELGLRDEVMRLRQQLEGLASISNADTLSTFCFGFSIGLPPWTHQQSLDQCRGAGPPGGECKMWSDARGNRPATVFYR
jgi:hypothetical protein